MLRRHRGRHRERKEKDEKPRTAGGTNTTPGLIDEGEERGRRDARRTLLLTSRVRGESTIAKGGAMSVSASQMARSRTSTLGEVNAPRALGSEEATRRAVRAIAPEPCSGRMRS